MLSQKRDVPDREDGVGLPKRRKLRNGSFHQQHRACGQKTKHSALDRLSILSDELLLRILSYLSVQHLLEVGPVSRRFYHLSEDSQLWREHYCMHFVLPRALRMPGFGVDSSQSRKYSRAIMRRDGNRDMYISRARGDVEEGRGPTAVNWKRQYRLRHNWSLGKCAVEELTVGEWATDGGLVGGSESPRKTLVKVTNGLAITADSANGLRVWDLKSKALITQIGLRDGAESTLPTCMALGSQGPAEEGLEIAIGFSTGGFGIWRLDMGSKALSRRYRHRPSTAEALVGVAYYYPYIMTATDSVLVSIYAFGSRSRRAPTAGGGTHEEMASTGDSGSESETLSESTTMKASDSDSDAAPAERAPQARAGAKAAGKDEPEIGATLSSPHLVSSLTSHSAATPLALSIRKAGVSFIASIAHTLPNRNGWSLGLQDLHLRPGPPGFAADVEISHSRIAHSLPFSTGGARTRYTAGGRIPGDGARHGPTASQGPTSLCYTHPYLLATLPDNTLVLHLCTSNATTLSISTGMRLWGHTSGVSDAEITSRGKAVSVSCRGDEVRVWELEGRAGRSSVEVRPTLRSPARASKGQREGRQGALEGSDDVDNDGKSYQDAGGEGRLGAWDDQRNWVGFDDEMVIILKESKVGKESLLVYDFS